MSNFHEIRLPTDISFGSTGGPEFSTDIVSTQSGHEQRQVNWSAARASYNVAHGVRTQSQLDELISFFRARHGRAYGFRFKDWQDYSATAQIIGVGDDAEISFQLTKTYISGNEQYVRTINKIVDNSVNIYVDSVLVSSGLTVDNNNGVVAFDVAPSNGQIITADFEFDVPVRFNTDQLSASIDEYGVHSWKDISLVEIRV